VDILLIGKSGKMGRALSQMIQQDDRLQEVEQGGDLVIDFSNPDGTRKGILEGKPLVCGTTGLPSEIFSELKNFSQKYPVLYSPNFSLGIALFFHILDQMGPKLKKFSSPSISETHHVHKKDAPSGTALHMANLLEMDPTQIETIREKEVVGEHQVDFLFDNEILSLSHKALSRNAFAYGALEAAKFLLNKPPKLYSIGDLFD